MRKVVIASSNPVSNFANNLVRYCCIIGKQWKQDYPEEHVDAEYMEWEYKRNSYGGWVPPFIERCLKNNTIIINEYGTLYPFKSYANRCYYNATGYVKNLESKYKQLDLAFGFTVSKDFFERLANAVKDPRKFRQIVCQDATLHAFCIQDGCKIVDPTLKKEHDDCYYFYEIVPKDIWSKFPWIPKDVNQDGRPLCDLAEKHLDKYKQSFNFVARYNKLMPILDKDIQQRG